MNASFIRLVGLVARRDYVRTVRRRGFILGTLLLPASMVLLFAISGLVSTGAIGEPPSGPLAVVNESQVPLTPDLALTPHAVIVGRSEAEQMMATGAVDEFFVVPAGWPTDTQLLLIVDEASAGSIEGLSRQQEWQAEVDLLLRTSLLRAAGLPDETLVQLLSPITVEAVTTTGEPVSEASVVAGFALPYLFTMVFVLSIFITSGYLLQSVTEEKENRVVEIVLSSIRALPLMSGKILGLGAAGLTQVLIWLLTGLIAIPLINQQFSVDVTVSPVTVVVAVVVFCLGYLGYGAIFAAVGALAPGAREAQQYSGFFGFFAVIPLIFTPVFVSDPTSWIVVALALFPLTAPAAALELVALPATPWALVGMSITSQLIFVVVATIAAGRIFRATLLLYGTQPSVRGILSALTARA